ncbi:hypothetical protein CPAR01_12881 [Colletotrichum paranaense]|uniref:Uncharacterized protein n=1 Tax=Colletotrichum paranaense TaxID=1914294 RepID=A0ABQ9S803_9PEZI|nr:uncharacterized protein CPAR01_12881 [Colletotrichum paranaense]KAK1528323.1 hypothetical protein CPAR01_12881 [Colletotrichum paranaense]
MPSATEGGMRKKEKKKRDTEAYGRRLDESKTHAVGRTTARTESPLGKTSLKTARGEVDESGHLITKERHLDTALA